MPFFKKIIFTFRFWGPPLAWALVMYLFSSEPTGSASQIHWQDFIVKKTAHLIEYATLTILNYRALYNSGIMRKKASIIALTVSAIFAITDETHQAFTPGREPHARDIVIDIIGSGIATYLLWNILPKTPKKLRDWAKDFQLT